MIKRGLNLHKTGRKNGDGTPGRDWQAPVAIILLFLVLIIPLRQLTDKVEDLQQQNNRWLAAADRARLLDEIDLFRKDLDPEAFVSNYTGKVVSDIDLKKEFSRLKAIEQPLMIEAALNHIFARLHAALYSGNKWPEPLFTVMVNDTFDRFRYHYADAMGAKVTSPRETAFFLCSYSIFSGYIGIGENLRDDIEQMIKNWSATDSRSAGFQRQHKKVIGSYIGRVPNPEKVSRYLSDYYNFSNVLYYSYPVYSDDSFAGMVVVGFLESDISRQNMLKLALSKGNLPSGVRRFTLSGEKIEPSTRSRLVVPLPAGFSGANELVMGVELTEKSEDKFEFFKSILRLCSGISLLGCFALLMQSFFFRLRFNLGLRYKLMIILALVLLVPAVLVVVIFAGISDNYLLSRVDLAQSLLASNLDELELYNREVASRQVVNNLTLKLRLENLLKEVPPSKLNQEMLDGYWDGNLLKVFFLNVDGDQIAFSDQRKLASPDLFALNNPVRLLNNLAGFNVNQKTTRLLKNLNYTEGFVSELVDVLGVREVMANEGENIANMSSMNLFSRDMFHLFADRGRRPWHPHSIGFYHLSPDAILGRYIVTCPTFPLKFFEHYEDDYQVNIALALRSNEALDNEFWLDHSNRRQPGLRRLFQNALVTMTSGNAVAEDAPDTVTAWRTLADSPVVFVGTAAFGSDSFKKLYFDIAPWAIFAYSLLILMLISELVSRLFLSPIRTVSYGVRAVGDSDDLTLRLHIRNNDEFDRMGEAFNQMTAGLLQKRHISRFVSDRLLADTGAIQDNSGLEEAEVAVLSSDLRNFTGISEKYPPQTIVEVLNDYFTAMEGAIKAEHGSIDKFIGDAITAIFYDQPGLDTPAHRACRAALRMRSLLSAFNRGQQAAGRFSVENGVGIVCGKVVSASIGEAGGRREFIAVGAPIQRAEELEAVSRHGQYSRIIVDKVTSDQISASFKVVSLPAADGCFEIVEEALRT